MRSIAIITTGLVICGVFACPIIEIVAPAASPGLAATADAGEAFKPLKRRFQLLYRSLDAQGGISEQDMPVITEIRRQVREFNNEHSDYTTSLAAELQLSMWLEDHEGVNEMYQRIVALNPDETGYAVSWAQYFVRQGDRARADEIYDMLLNEYPENVDLVMHRARQLKQQNEYPRIIQLLRRANPDPIEHREAVLLLSESLMSDNRFAESLEALDRFPESLLEEDGSLRTRINQRRDSYSELLELWHKELDARAAEESADDLPRIRLVTEQGDIILELFENHAANTVANFITLAEQGYYDGTRFHRVIPEFMAQGGDPNSRPGVVGEPGQGGPGYTIPDEHEGDDVRMHFAGSLAMANTGAPNSGGSQFYITHRPTSWLNNRHTVFGRVLDGLDVARRIQRNDELVLVEILRKRDHEYGFTKIGDEPVEVEPVEVESAEEDVELHG